MLPVAKPAVSLHLLLFNIMAHSFPWKI